MDAPTGAHAGSRLPHPRTSLIGRERECQYGVRLLITESAPLLTLLGPGGVGKTRLALEIAHQVADAYVDGVTVVDLYQIRSPDLALSSIAQALGLHATGSRPMAQVLADSLRSRQCLLLLDNFEHVLAAARDIADLMAACPAVQLLVTSRAPLRIRAEQLLPVEPLPLPGSTHPSPEELTSSDAARLFIARAKSARPWFTPDANNAGDIAAIVTRLDGLPLALELAASRLRTVDVHVLRERLTDHSETLSSGPRDASARQRTLADTIAWSYDLLQPDEQQALRHLSVIPGAFDIELASAVMDAPVAQAWRWLEALADHSLLAGIDGQPGVSRFRMLETVREYAGHALADRGEEAIAGRRLTTWCLGFALEVEAQLDGEHPAGAHDRFAEALPSVRYVLQWCLTHQELETGLRISCAIHDFWGALGQLRQGRDWHERLLAADGDVSPTIRARALAIAAEFPRNMGNLKRARMYLDDALALAHELGDPALLGETLCTLADVAANSGQLAEAWEHGEAAIEWNRSAGSVRKMGWSHHVLALVAVWERRFEAATHHFDQARACFESAHDDRGIAWVMTGSARAARDSGNLIEGARRFGDALKMHVRHQEIIGIGCCLFDLAGIASATNNAVLAIHLCAAMERQGALTGVVHTPFDLIPYEEVLRRGRTELGDRGFRQAWADGTELTAAQAIDLALRFCDDVFAQALPAPSGGLLSAGDLPLSPREREVLHLLCQHWTAPEIATHLSLSSRTVESHVAHIYNKLGVSNRRDALAMTALLRSREAPVP